MQEKPIIFQPWKVRKILEWDKWPMEMHTRRLLRKQPADILPMLGDLAGKAWVTLDERKAVVEDQRGGMIRCRYGVPGDHLYVKENISVEIGATKSQIECGAFTYKADDLEGLWTKETGFRTIPSIHMFKWMARIWLKIVDVRAERLQDIDNHQAWKEGTEESFFNLLGLHYVEPQARHARWHRNGARG